MSKVSEEKNQNFENFLVKIEKRRKIPRKKSE